MDQKREIYQSTLTSNNNNKTFVPRSIFVDHNSLPTNQTESNASCLIGECAINHATCHILTGELEARTEKHSVARIIFAFFDLLT